MAPDDPQGIAAADSDAATEVEAREAPASADPSVRLPPKIGRFTLIRKLGEGGMGAVYMAYDEALNRRVALKLLHPRVDESESVRIRMQREAQALAQISHPNVVQIYDVGTFGGRVFVAMELVQGDTLRAYCKAAPRSWREIVGLLLQAGEGLSAAHQAGLIHRDIKPDNILVGADGRVRVADFGLARSEHISEPASPASPPSLSASGDATLSSASALNSPLTVAGTLLGTPAYMAPEQHLRQPADSRADIFSFCVVLYEGLYGKRPFTGSTRVLLARAIVNAEIPAPPPGSKVPAWIAKVLRRGLAADPVDRYPTMAALLADLRRDPARSRRRALAGVGLGVVLLGLGGLGAELRERRLEACGDAYAGVRALWGEARQEGVHAALSAQGALGEATWARVSVDLAGYVDRLYNMYEGTCQENRAGRTSDHLRDLTNECLDRRRAEVDALGELLLAADQEITERAASAVARLPELDACADVPRLLGGVAAPDDPAAQAAVREVRGRLDRIRALRRLGSFTVAADSAAAAAEAAREVDYPLVLAEALVEQGQVALELSEHARAAGELFPEALRLAEQVGDDDVRLAALSGLLAAHGASEAPIELVAFLAPQALALVERRGDTGEAPHGRLLLGLGETYMIRKDHPEALKWLGDAVELFTALGDAGRADLSAALNDLAMIQSSRKNYAEAHALYERAREALVGALGPRHPYIGHLHNNEARAFEKEGDLATARGHFEAALAIWEPVYGGEHKNIEIVTGHLARITLALGDLDAAEVHARRSLAIREAHPADKPRTEAQLLILARVAEARGDLGAASLLARRSLAAAEARYGAGAARLVAPLQLIAELALRQGEPRAAVEAATRALTLGVEGAAAVDLGLLVASGRWELGDEREAHAQVSALKAGAPAESRATISAWLGAHRLGGRGGR